MYHRFRPALMTLFCLSWAVIGGVLSPSFGYAQGEVDDGFRSLFNGSDLTGWVIPAGDNGHWKVVDGVIDYDSLSEAKGEKDLKTAEEFEDFILKIEWRLKETVGLYNVPIVLKDGTNLKDGKGNVITIKRPNGDSGIYLRGDPNAQLNIWCWPVGSGEVYSHRVNPKSSPEVRAGVTPSFNADRPVGQWNKFEIVLVGDRVTVMLNDHMILEQAQLPNIPDRGPITLQHHGGMTADGTLSPASSLVQFRNIWIKPL